MISRSAWSGRLLTDITKADVIELLDKIQDKGHDRARNRRLGTIRKMFNWFMERGVVQSNPAAGIKKLKENKRQRVLTDEELNNAQIAQPGHGAVVEMQRRLKGAVFQLEATTKAASRRMEYLTWALVGLTVIIVVLTIILLFQE